MTTPQPPAGFYPNEQGQMQWWDGAQWTAHQPPAKTGSGLETAGWIFAVLFPIVGFILGIVLVSKGQQRQGTMVMGVSALVLVVGAALLA